MEGITIKIMSIRSPSQGIHDLVTVSVTNQTKYLDTDEIVVKTTNNTAQDYADILKLALANSGFEVIREKFYKCFRIACMEDRVYQYRIRCRGFRC
jgi:hypothetical protein